jgi:C-terminal processing protease CtpA/Prc
MEKSIPDLGNVFERLHLAMAVFCGSDNLRQRLLAVRSQLLPLRVEDFPEHMRGQFRQLMEDLPKSEQAYFNAVGAYLIDVAHDIDRAIRELDCDRLVVDLRGNPGGGMGSLRVMSYFTPGQVPVGYSVTRKYLDRPDFDKTRLPRFDRIPDLKLGLVPLFIRFALHNRSTAVFAEGKGPQRFHGHVALLVNEHTASSSEMVTAFAAENGLATIVGSRTAGRLLGNDSFSVGYGYRLALPIVDYRTWRETRLEGKGVEPHLSAPFDPKAFRNGEDPQLAAAVAAVADRVAQRTAIG